MGKLGMWHRLGIVLTGVWVAGSSLYWFNEITGCSDGYCGNFIAGKESLDAAYYFWALPVELQFWRLGTFGNALYATAIFPAICWATAFTLRWVARGRTSKSSV